MGCLKYHGRDTSDILNVSLYHLLLTTFSKPACIKYLSKYTFNEFLTRIEKYRPKTFADVVGNSHIVDRLRVIAKEGNMPHMILTVYMSKI